MAFDMLSIQYYPLRIAAGDGEPISFFFIPHRRGNMKQIVYSLCFMCSIRCPIQVEVENDEVTWIQGNAKVAGIDGALCPRGAAARALLHDPQRLRTPLIRVGERGENRWREAPWDEALDLVAGRLGDIVSRHGARSVVLGERANLGTHVSKTFLRGLGSPNYFSHDALCKGSANTAFRSMLGYTDAQMNVDLKNTRHLILYGRNLLEAFQTKPARTMLGAIRGGCKLTYIDPCVTVTATKAHQYLMIRPGADLALNYALMHVLLRENLYDAAFADRWIHGLADLEAFVKPLTPQWAEGVTGIAAGVIETLAREAASVKPHVLFHPGYRAAHHVNEIHMRRAILMLNSLMGSMETPGGVFFKKGPGAVGRKPARKLTEQADLPAAIGLRFDKVGTPDFPLPDPEHGVGQMLPHAILNEDPYPIRAFISNRFDPIGSMPDSRRTIEAFKKLDLIVTIDVSPSDIAWFSDVVLPESIFLERTDCVQQANGLIPQIFLRRQAVNPRHDTREAGMIFKALAERMGFGRFFPYENMDDLVRWQLEGTGFSLEDFGEKGFVSYTDKAIWHDRDKLPFKTPSGKIEFRSALLEKAGFESLPALVLPAAPPEGNFRLITGRNILHTHVSTQNNPYLNERCPENVVWIHQDRAKPLGINDGDEVELASGQGRGRTKAYVSDLIHPDAAFLLHGFGHLSPQAGRSYGKGVSDSELQESLIDKVGGSPALHDTFITIRKAG